VNITRAGFDPVTIEDTDGEDTRVAVAVDAGWQPCVKLTCRAGMTFDQASGYLTPGQARAVAAALTDAADAAELAAFGDE
jgi:hypothetical protein